MGTRSIALALASVLVVGCTDSAPLGLEEAVVAPQFARGGGAERVSFEEYADFTGLADFLPCLGTAGESVTLTGGIDFSYRIVTTPSGQERTTFIGIYSQPFGFTVDATGEVWTFDRGTQSGGHFIHASGKVQFWFLLNEWYDSENGETLRLQWNYVGEPDFSDFKRLNVSCKVVN